MMLLHQVLPKDENGNKKMVETFLEGKMMLTDPMNGKGAFILTKYADKSLTFFFLINFTNSSRREGLYSRGNLATCE